MLASKDNPGNTQRKTFTTVEGRRPHSGKHKIKRKRLSYVNQIPKASRRSKPESNNTYIVQTIEPAYIRLYGKSWSRKKTIR